jgi:endonuclease YncB( thermonuclease family)
MWHLATTGKLGWAALAILAMLTPALAGARVIDGDTVDIDGTRIRLVEIDTPETHQPRCAREYELGLKAKQRLIELLDGAEVSYTTTGIDRYGRTLARLYAGETNVGEVLLKEGHALPYVPGSKAKAARLATWC